MMTNPKPTASLSSGLLARKGQARPAMRPQGFMGMNPAAMLEDLGWNDMGDPSLSAPASASVAMPAPMPIEDFVEPVEAPKPVVLRQIEALDAQLTHVEHEQEADEAEEAIEAFEAFEAEPVIAEPVVAEPIIAALPDPMPQLSDGALARVAREVSKKSKAAFTLRLDADRHLKLRLASAISGRSAQQLVTHALDVFLESMSGVDALARQVPTKSKG